MKPMKPHECNYYRSVDGSVAECLLCPHHCRIPPGQTGRCRSRRNLSGRLVSDAYGHPCALAIDPIEKKPLYHFHPGTKCLSIACTGCNFRCLHCQNHEISQAAPHEVRSTELLPDEVVALCMKEGCPGMAYTYTEPLTYLEYVVDTARRAHAKGLWNVLVTAGYVNAAPLADLLPYLDAANIDLKYFSDDLYRRMSGGQLSVVLDTILAMHDAGVWIELTYLVIPGVNDDFDQIRAMSQWMAAHALTDVPLHLNRFFPRYRMRHMPPTPLRTLEMARDVVLGEGIKHVYIGNV